MVHRYNVTINFPSSHPVNSLSAMRLLAATPDSSTSRIRQELSHALFSSYWIENKGINNKGRVGGGGVIFNMKMHRRKGPLLAKLGRRLLGGEGPRRSIIGRVLPS